MEHLANPTGEKVRVFLVDEAPLVRRGLAAVIRNQPGWEVCGAVSGGTEALHEIMALQPDVAIVDLRVRVDGGLELIRQLRQDCPAVKILGCSMHADAAFVEAAFQAGAEGYITKSEATETLIEAIKAVVAGKPCFSAPFESQSSSGAPPLTSVN